MSSGAAQWGQFLAVQALVKRLAATGILTITPAGLALIDDADASAQLTTLGVSTFIKTLLDDANAAAARATLEVGTPFVAYTPTFTGFGTVSAVSFWSRRVGDTLEGYGKFTAGTVAASEARITLGFNGVNGGITSDATKIASIQFAGLSIRDTVGANQFVALIESNVGYITFGSQGAATAGLTKQNASAMFASGAVVSVHFRVPISGW